jgi:hypothetical protein
MGVLATTPVTQNPNGCVVWLDPPAYAHPGTSRPDACTSCLIAGWFYRSMLRKGAWRDRGACQLHVRLKTSRPMRCRNCCPFLNCCRQACNLRNLNAGELQMAVKCTRCDRHCLLLPSTLRVQIGNTIVRILRHNTSRRSLEDLACQYTPLGQHVCPLAWASTTPPSQNDKRRDLRLSKSFMD